eukprot:5050535-Pyramimonas_sp.AAC.1
MFSRRDYCVVILRRACTRRVYAVFQRCVTAQCYCAVLRRAVRRGVSARCFATCFGVDDHVGAQCIGIVSR